MLGELLLLATLAAEADSLWYSGRDGELEVNPPKLVDPRINVDGILDEKEWSESAILGDFTQYAPIEGIDALEPTEVRVFYTEEAIYFGIRAYDSEPDQILARFRERDRVTYNDDWVRIILDTFDDRRQAYALAINPFGLQADGLIVEGSSSGSGGRGGGRQGGSGGGGGGGGGSLASSGRVFQIDFNPDFIWESAALIDSKGWTGEIRIPYVSLRFRELREQTWGIQIEREVKRRRFRQSWAPLTKEISSALGQSGRLIGLRDINPRRLVEVNPVATGIRAGDSRTGTYQSGSFDDQFGFNGRVGVTQNMVLDGTYNPDFSQIEADVSQITVNERFALFFPEKRPFFLSGTEVFNTPQRLVYTRQIVDPLSGLKLTGKVGGFNVGYIGALDESPGTASGTNARAQFNMLRVRRDIGSGSTLGVLYTGRGMSNDSGVHNHVLSGDARLLFADRYTLTTQVAGSFDRSKPGGEQTSLSPLIMASVDRSGRELIWNVTFTDIHPDFRARSGFITRAGNTQADARITFNRLGKPGAVLERTSLTASTQNFFGHNDFWGGSGPFEHELQVMSSFTFRGGRSLSFLLRNGYFDFQPENYADYTTIDEGGAQSSFITPEALRNLKALMVSPRMRLSNAFSLNGTFMARETPIYAEASRGFEIQARPEIEWTPTDRLALSLDHTFSRISRSSNEQKHGVSNALYSTVNVTNMRAQYFFNRSIMARIIVQYDLDEREPLTDPSTGYQLAILGRPQTRRSTGEFQGQFLFQYEPSPGTIFYIGLSQVMEGQRSYRLSTMNLAEDAIFLKISYLFRI